MVQALHCHPSIYYELMQFNMVEDAKLQQIITMPGRELGEKGEELLREANQNGGKDNIAIVLIEPFTNEVEKC